MSVPGKGDPFGVWIKSIFVLCPRREEEMLVWEACGLSSFAFTLIKCSMLLPGFQEYWRLYLLYWGWLLVLGGYIWLVSWRAIHEVRSISYLVTRMPCKNPWKLPIAESGGMFTRSKVITADRFLHLSVLLRNPWKCQFWYGLDNDCDKLLICDLTDMTNKMVTKCLAKAAS